MMELSEVKKWPVEYWLNTLCVVIAILCIFSYVWTLYSLNAHGKRLLKVSCYDDVGKLLYTHVSSSRLLKKSNLDNCIFEEWQ